jgi:DNA end-binding protein Ku
MPNAVWTGDLSFGLVNIPIKLYPATSSKRVRFHQHEARTGRRIRYRRAAEGPVPDVIPPRTWETEPETARRAVVQGPFQRVEAEGSIPLTTPEGPAQETEVSWDEIVKGYEVEPGSFVTVDDKELESVAPQPSRVIDVEQFVDLKEIDPVYFEKSYYVVPQRGPTTERPYRLLYRTMEEAGKVAIGRFVMRTKEYVVAVRPTEHVLMLETLFYDDEVRDPKALRIPAISESSERELRVARQLLETLTAKWEPARYRDEHRQRLLDLIDGKVDNAIAMPETPTEAPMTEVSDLMEALLASVEAAKWARAV